MKNNSTTVTIHRAMIAALKRRLATATDAWEIAMARDSLNHHLAALAVEPSPNGSGTPTPRETVGAWALAH